jgi:hypothetical protein
VDKIIIHIPSFGFDKIKDNNTFGENTTGALKMRNNFVDIELINLQMLLLVNLISLLNFFNTRYSYRYLLLKSSTKRIYEPMMS